MWLACALYSLCSPSVHYTAIPGPSPSLTVGYRDLAGICECPLVTGDWRETITIRFESICPSLVSTGRRVRNRLTDFVSVSRWVSHPTVVLGFSSCDQCHILDTRAIHKKSVYDRAMWRRMTRGATHHNYKRLPVLSRNRIHANCRICDYIEHYQRSVRGISA